MLMSPSEDETVVPGGDMFVRMRKVMVVPRNGYVCVSIEIGIIGTFYSDTKS